METAFYGSKKPCPYSPGSGHSSLLTDGVVRNLSLKNIYLLDLPGGSVVNNSSTSAGVIGLIPGLGRFHMLQGN